MGAKRPSVKDDERYEKLRQKGKSKEKAARIANTPRKKANERVVAPSIEPKGKRQ